MKKIALMTLLGLSLGALNTAYARDDVGSYSIAEALSLEDAKNKLGSNIQFYFGSQTHPKIEKNFGNTATNKKTNAFNKSDKEACQWVFLSAMLQLKDRAEKEGGNAVINIKSNYKNNLTTSDTEFKCGAGTFMAGVALTGDVVKLAQ
jgi:uncharacterized protein YbjQ (UPF0145 family)